MSPTHYRPALAVLSAALLLLTTADAAAQVSLNSPYAVYTESFNSLAGTGTTGSAVPAGWAFVETGTGANTTYGVGDGTSTTANTYSFGTTGSTDRAFGALGSNQHFTTLGASFVNNTGQPLTGVVVTYQGEQWRRGTGNAPDRLDFAYSTDATSLTTGTWTDVNALDFSSPVTSGSKNVPLDGNAAGNFTTVTGTVAFATPVPVGGMFFVRWTDFNSTAAEDALAVDDFTITPVPEPTSALAVAGLAGAAAWAWRRRRPRPA